MQFGRAKLKVDIRFLFAYNPTYPGSLIPKSSGGLIMLTVTAHHIGDTVVLRCHGRLVRGDESALLCAAVQRHGDNIVLDMSGVSAIDAAGIGALVSLQA